MAFGVTSKGKDMITVEMVREKGFEVVEGDNVWRDIANEFIPLSELEVKWIKEKVINSCSAIKEFAWRDNKGKMPCDGELLVEIEFYESLIRQVETHKACDIDWEEDLQMKWRPSLKNWDDEMNVDKIETQEGKEAFEGMANNSEAPNNSDWNGEGLPPVGVVCEVYGALGKYNEWQRCNVFAIELGQMFVSNEKVWVNRPVGEFKFRKLETPEQKAEREREEWVLNVISELMGATGLDFTNDSDIEVMKAMYDLNYRKQNG